MTETSGDGRWLELALVEQVAALEAEVAAMRAAEREAAYGQAQAQLIDMETRLQGIIRDPGPTVRRGVVVRDGDGQPVPSEAVRRRARVSLERVRADWAKLTGETTEAPTGPPASGHPGQI